MGDSSLQLFISHPVFGTETLKKEVATAFPFVGHKEGRVLLDFSIPFVLSSMLGNKCLPAMHHVHYGCVC